MSGVELAVRMREQRPDAPLYVVAMTGFSASGSPIVAAFDEYLVKPVAQEILAAAVARASARRLPAA
jgi:CheY-like chemotaxis protein